jgi:type IV secretory pathway TrbD component
VNLIRLLSICCVVLLIGQQNWLGACWAGVCYWVAHHALLVEQHRDVLLKTVCNMVEELAAQDELIEQYIGRQVNRD